MYSKMSPVVHFFCKGQYHVQYQNPCVKVKKHMCFHASLLTRNFIVLLHSQALLQKFRLRLCAVLNALTGEFGPATSSTSGTAS